MLGSVDILIVAVFIMYSIAAGFRSKDVASKNLEEYFLAGRSLKGWQAGISMAATQFAADTPLLFTGLIAVSGIFSLWWIWSYALSFLLVGFVIAPCWRRAGVLTDAELTERRYGQKTATLLRGLKAIYFGTIFNCTVLAIVLLAATRIAEPFLLWHLWLPDWLYQPVLSFVQWLNTPITTFTDNNPEMWIRSANNFFSIGAIVLVTTFYSTTGGLRSVVATDVLQFAIAMLATAAYAGFVVVEVGGFQAIAERLTELYGNGGPGGIRPSELLAFTPCQAKDASLSFLAVVSLQWLVQMNADGTGYLAQRSMACRSDIDAKRASVVFTVAQIIFRSLLWIAIGLGLLIILPPDPSLTGTALTAEREASFVRGIVELLPTGIKGLMLTGMLAALASTIDTHLNWGASYWSNDIYRRFVCQYWLKREPNDRTLVWVARGSNVLILAIALVIMTQISSIQTAWKISLLFGAGMGVMLVLRWLWWRLTALGEITAIGVSLVLAPLLLWIFPDEREALRLLIVAVVSTGAGIAASLLTEAEDAEQLREFYRRARPLGFWGPQRAALGEDPQAGPRQLGWTLVAVVSATFSVFFLLTSVGTWLFNSPPPTWFPWRSAWILLSLTVSLTLVPFWWRQVFPSSLLLFDKAGGTGVGEEVYGKEI
jgi:Na+/proline symporter